MSPRSQTELGCLALHMEMPEEEGLAGSDLAADAQGR